MNQHAVDSTTDGDRNQNPALPSLPTRIVQVFVAPATLFDALKATPKWIGAALVVIGLGLVVQALIPAEMIREMALSSLPSDASPEQVAAVEQFMGVSNVIRWVGTIVFPILLMLFVSGFILLVWNAILGGEAAFPAVLACTAHSYIVWAAGGLITMPLVLAPGSPNHVLIAPSHTMARFGLLRVPVHGRSEPVRNLDDDSARRSREPSLPQGLSSQRFDRDDRRICRVQGHRCDLLADVSVVVNDRRTRGVSRS